VTGRGVGEAEGSCPAPQTFHRNDQFARSGIDASRSGSGHDDHRGRMVPGSPTLNLRLLSLRKQDLRGFGYSTAWATRTGGESNAQALCLRRKRPFPSAYEKLDQSSQDREDQMQDDTNSDDRLLNLRENRRFRCQRRNGIQKSRPFRPYTLP
jgi:hypothetical protein